MGIGTLACNRSSTALLMVPGEELSRVLRHWAGNMKHYDLGQPATETVYDSQYREVGHWRLA
jgi:hypothetical protein